MISNGTQKFVHKTYYEKPTIYLKNVHKIISGITSKGHKSWWVFRKLTMTLLNKKIIFRSCDLFMALLMCSIYVKAYISPNCLGKWNKQRLDDEIEISVSSNKKHKSHASIGRRSNTDEYINNRKQIRRPRMTVIENDDDLLYAVDFCVGKYIFYYMYI